MKRLLTLATALSCFSFANAQTARVQVIHNSADRAADTVDVWLDNAPLIDNFAFRTATKFIDAPAGRPIRIGIAPKTSTSVADTIYTATVTLTASATYVIVANGLVSTTGYTPSAAMAPFRLSIMAMAKEVSDTAGRVSVAVAHGSTDAPTVDVKAGSSTLVNDIAFGQFSSGYLSLPEANYTLDVTNSAGSVIVKRYSAPLATLNLGDSAITVVASGFLDSTVNSNGRKFGLWVATRMGGNLIPLPELPLPSSVSNIRVASANTMVYPNPANDFISIANPANDINTVTVTDMSGRTLITQSGATNKIDVSQLLTGMYIVRMDHADGATTVERFLKQ
jgi:hypothetical protein